MAERSQMRKKKNVLYSLDETFTSSRHSRRTTNENEGVVTSTERFSPLSSSRSTNVSSVDNLFGEFCSIFSPCLNDGTCSDDVRRPFWFNCSCPDHVEGRLCEMNNRACQPNRCFHSGPSLPMSLEWREKCLFRQLFWRITRGETMFVSS